MTTLFKRSLGIVFLWLIVVDATRVAAIHVKRHELRSVRAQYGSARDAGEAPVPEGFSPSASPVVAPAANRPFAVWYGSDKCPFSKKDEQWGRVAATLQQKGVEVFVLLPDAAQAFPAESVKPAAAQQLAFVNGEWLKRYPVTITPSLLVFDADRKLIWHRWGMLRPEDASAAIRAVDDASRRAVR